jgi:alpha-D-ribose 1-methylphosphonate 5-triphosphate synthase subunit PhnI
LHCLDLGDAIALGEIRMKNVNMVNSWVSWYAPDPRTRQCQQLSLLESSHRQTLMDRLLEGRMYRVAVEI